MNFGMPQSGERLSFEPASDFLTLRPKWQLLAVQRLGMTFEETVVSLAQSLSGLEESGGVGEGFTGLGKKKGEAG